MNTSPNLASSQLFTLQAGSITAVQDFEPIALKDRVVLDQVINKRYRLNELIGQGGMGAVYRAYHIPLDKDVALKTLLTPAVKESAWNQFQNESKILARLDHPNVVKVLDCGIAENGSPFYTMELLPGQSLDARIKGNGLEIKEALQIFIQVSKGLAAAHDKGIIHRDIKPANIFLESTQAGASEKERSKIIDFGIASMAAATHDQNLQARTGSVFGSPLYMSPEQARGDSLTPATDVYSCGCALYHALTGNPPFKGDSAFETILMHLTAEAPELTSVLTCYVPQRLNTLLNAMLAKEIERRPKSLHEVADELTACLKVLSSGRTRDSKQNLPGIESINSEPEQNEEPLPIAFAPRLSPAYFWGAGIIAAGISATLFQNQILSLFRNDHTGVGADAQKSVQTASAKSSSVDPLPNPAVNALLSTDAQSTISAQTSDILAAPSPSSDENKPSTIASAPATISLQDKRPFSEIIHGNVRKFQFPEEIAIGQIGAPGEQPRPARGLQYFQANLPLVFYPDTCLQNYPQLVDRFRAGDIATIQFMRESGTRELLSLMSKVPGVRQVALVGCSKIDRSDLLILNRYPALSRIAFDEGGFKLEDMAQPPLLAKLTCVACYGQTPKDDLLKRLEASQRLEQLDLSNSSVSHNGFKSIAQLSQLQNLNLSKCKYDPKDLNELTGLAKLSQLNIAGQDINPETLKSLHKIKKLNNLWISPSRLSGVSREDFRRTMPRTRIIASE